ncbi:hypothetical protein BGZ70_009093 [Mortierella alpina]|uniref:Uncharacterized protein n=1 Tax=Mortierella alpina TaxID=64518 RepID=A0A9P6JGI7_MORAP|nr:hypothetical protein BGZ70_009093 [Mortierella alpina]
MTPEELDQPLETSAPELLAQSDAAGTTAPDALGHTADLDMVSAAKDSYILKGWMVLNDGCPDCNTPLLRNQEATNQVCVNCEINPPIDPEDQDDDELQLLDIESEPESPLPATDSNNTLLGTMTMPAPTSVLPSAPAPGAYRPPPHTNHRISVLDPAMDGVRKAAFRSPSGRIIGGQGPPPHSAPPPPTAADFPQPPPQRASTPLPLPPRIPPPPPKVISGSLSHSLAFPLPPGPPPPANPLASPPFSPLAPKLNPRDKRRSPQSSVVMQGNVLPPSSPPPRRPTLPTPPSSSAIIPGLGSGSDAHTNLQNAEVTAEIMHESTGWENKGSDLDTARYHTALIATQPAEGEDEKGLESHDEFVDAAEEVVHRFSDHESKQNEVRKEQNEKASRLMGEKMLQGWTMLQEPCPNAGCFGVPLMRSREQKEFCVVCETYYPLEQEQEQGKHSIAPSTASAAAKPNGIATSAVSLTASRFPAPPTTLPPAPRATSPTFASASASASTSPQFRATSPISSPGQPRVSAALQGRISSSIILPPPASMSPSFGMTSQQILHRVISEDMDKLASEDEETKKHLQMIGKVSEFSAKSLPPVPPVPLAPASSASRPTSTYSNSSGYNSSDRERSQRHHPQNAGASHSGHPEQNARIPAPPVLLTPEIQAIVNATHKTMATLLSKLELYRLALEVSDNPKECHALATQIKGIMECLRVCREVL